MMGKKCRIIYPTKNLKKRTGIENGYKVNGLEFENMMERMVRLNLKVSVLPDPCNSDALVMFVSEPENRCYRCANNERPNVCMKCSEFYSEKTNHPSLFWAFDPDVTVLVRGGVVQNVIKKDDVNITVEIIDYDTDGADEESLSYDASGDDCFKSQY